jgi:SAM-dependent methyltransferase
MNPSLYGRLRGCFRAVVPLGARRMIWSRLPFAPLVEGLKRRLARNAAHDEVYDAEYFAHLHATTERSAGILASSLVESFRPRRVIDVGCGSGALLAALRDRGVEVLGYDLAAASLAACRARGLDARAVDLASTHSLGERADVVVSTEVAEHLSEASAESFVSLLTATAGVIVFTAATPGQGGTDHLNEQPNEYWIALFRRHGFEYQERLTQQWRREWAEGDAASWYHRNLMVFRRPEVLP